VQQAGGGIHVSSSHPPKPITFVTSVRRPHHVNRRGESLEDFMKSLALKVRNFLVSEDGPTAVEYAVMLALIIIVCLTAISAIGTNADTTFQTIADSIATAS
jgi:pilus assembly protein Flp/PilA